MSSTSAKSIINRRREENVKKIQENYNKRKQQIEQGLHKYKKQQEEKRRENEFISFLVRANSDLDEINSDLDEFNDITENELTFSKKEAHDLFININELYKN